MLNIKFTFEKESRKATYDNVENLTYEKLVELINRTFPGLEGKEFQVCYHDDENDLVTFSSNDELGDAINFMLPKSSVLKFTIQTPSSSASSTGNGTTTTKGGKKAASKKGSTAVLASALSAQASALIGDNVAETSSDSTLPLPSTTNGGKKRKQAATTADMLMTVEGGGEGMEGTIGMGAEGGEGEEGFLTTPNKKKRHCYTVADKVHLVKEFNDVNANGMKKPMKQFAIEHGVNHKTFSSWCKEFQEGKLNPYILESSHTDTKRLRLRRAEYPQIEKALFSFIESYDPNQTVSWSLIRSYALKIAKDELEGDDLTSFKASDGWIQNFLKRNNIVLHRRMKLITGDGVDGGGVAGGEGSSTTMTATAGGGEGTGMISDDSGDDEEV
jgi:transposase-like protein